MLLWGKASIQFSHDIKWAHIEVTVEFPWAFAHSPLLRWSQMLIHTSGSRCLCDFWHISHTNLGCLQWCLSFWQTAGVSECSFLDSRGQWWCTAETFYIRFTFHCLSAFLRKETYGSFIRSHMILSSCCKLMLLMVEFVLKLTDSCIISIFHF